MDIMVKSPSTVHNGGAGISKENQDRLIAAEVMTKFSHYASKSEKNVPPIFDKTVNGRCHSSDDISGRIGNKIIACTVTDNTTTITPVIFSKIKNYHSIISQYQSITTKAKIGPSEHPEVYVKLPSKTSVNNGIPQSLKFEQQQQKDLFSCGCISKTSTDNLAFSPTSNTTVNTITTGINNNEVRKVSDNSAEEMIVDISSPEKEKEKLTEISVTITTTTTTTTTNNNNNNNETNSTNNRTIRKNSLPVLNARILKELLDTANNQGLVYLIHPFNDNFLVRSINKKDFINSFLKAKQKSSDVIDPQNNDLLSSSETPIWGVIKRNRSIHFFDPPPKESKDLHNTHTLFEYIQNKNTETGDSLVLANLETVPEKLASTLPLKKRKIADSLLNISGIPTSPLPLSTYLFTSEDTSKPTKSVSQIAEECIRDRSVFVVSPSDVPKFVKAALSKPWGDSTNQQRPKNIEIALCQDEDGDLPLHIATVQKNLKMVNLYGMLIQRAGKSVDRYNKKNLTPLHLCVKVRFLAGLQKLIQMGADVNALDGNGQSALHIAVSNSDLECFEILLQQSTIYIKDTKMKPNFNSHDYEGMTLLHTAVNNNDIKMIDRLLQIGAELDAIDFKSGRTPLFHAVENNNIEIVEFLLEKKASVDIPNFAGNTAFLAANTRDYHEISKILADNGADTRGLMTSEELTPAPKMISAVKSQLKNKLVSSKTGQILET